MSRPTSNNTIRTQAFVLHRTNFGEADRILKLLTPQGKLSVMAKGVRHQKSKLAGGIELFCLSDVVIHRGRGHLDILTSTKMLKHYDFIITDLARLELASTALKHINRASDDFSSQEHFDILKDTLSAINRGVDLQLIEAWFLLNLARISGEEPNLYRDCTGTKLQPSQSYLWDLAENALRPHSQGNISAPEIKLMRLMLTSRLDLVTRVKGVQELLPTILHLAQVFNKLWYNFWVRRFMQEDTRSVNYLDEIVSLCKRRGFIFPGSDIYGGMSGTWDYGPLGVALKRKITALWWDYWVEKREDMYGVDTTIIMNPRTWVASGHTDTFSDPLVECKKCHNRFRADQIASVSEKVSSDEFRAQHVKCPVCQQEDWDDVKQFNMMFTTHVGSVVDDSSLTYLRPETAQGIFTNYKNIVDSIYPDLPFGVAQQGKAFRNEISPRDFIFRSREFEQMEIEYFVHPNHWEEAFDQMLASCHDFLTNILGLPKTAIHEYHVPDNERAHYSARTVDLEYDFPAGRDELMGIAYRADFDLKNIERESGKSMAYRDKVTGESFIPHVVEPSFGTERLIMAILTAAYAEDEVNGEKRIVLKLPTHLAPYRFCVSPLLKNKPELVAKAKSVYDTLRTKYGNVTWDDSGNIGKRYRRQDEIGTPQCIVVDFETLEDDTVTVRDRDTTQQVRTKIAEL